MNRVKLPDYGEVIINGNGILTIKGGTISSTSTGSFSYCINGGSGTIDISGGELSADVNSTSNRQTIKNIDSASSSSSITGGTFITLFLKIPRLARRGILRFLATCFELIVTLLNFADMNVQTQQVIDILSEFKAKNSDRYSFSALGLFGSMARGEYNEDSDVDVAVEFKYATLFSVSRMQSELEAILCRKVDLVSLKASMLPGFREEIMRDIIYV